MRILKGRFRSGEEFRESFDEDLEAGGLFCPTTRPLEEQEDVVVEVHFPEIPNKMLLRGKVLWWRPALPRLRIRAGAMVAFLEEERDKMEFMLDVAGGNRRAVVKRRHPRIPISMPTRWRTAESLERRESELRDISIGGALLVTGDKPAVGEEIIVELPIPGGAQPVDIAAKVTHEGPAGVGLRFLYREGGGSQRLREVVRRLVSLG